MLADRLEPERGFTLVEVLVALVVAGLLTTILLGGATMARTRAAQTELQREAVFVAASLIAEQQVAPYEAEAGHGTTNGLVWTTNQSILVADPRGTYALVRIEADIDDRAGHRLYAATTRKLKALPRT